MLLERPRHGVSTMVLPRTLDLSHSSEPEQGQPWGARTLPVGGSRLLEPRVGGQGRPPAAGRRVAKAVLTGPTEGSVEHESRPQSVVRVAERRRGRTGCCIAGSTRFRLARGRLGAAERRTARARYG